MSTGDVTRGGGWGPSTPAAHPLPILLTLQHQPGADSPPIKAVQVSFSPDDGTTWHPAPTIHNGQGAALTVIPNPPTPTYISLRITAQDTAGNAVTQTLTRAYQTT